jgi:lipopolysaccharide export system permease protein
VFWHILHRMIFWELVKVFSLSLLGITGILLMAGIVAEASQQGLTLFQLLEIIPLLIPSTLPYTIPATTLFATCVVYGRLSADNEILAIKAAGINAFTVVWAGVFLGILMSSITMGLYYRIIPYTHGLMRSMFLNDVEESLYSILRRDHAINQPRLSYAIWVRQVQGRKLLNALFKRRSADGHYDLIALAREAELRVDVQGKQILVMMRNGYFLGSGGDSWLFFESRAWEVDLGPSLTADKQRRPRDLTWQEILQRRREMVELEDSIVTEMALTTSRLATNQPPENLPKHLANLKEKRKYTQLEIHALDAELYMRPALSLGCLCFILVACPVGIWFSRSDYLSSFITCFLPIVFIYYPLMLCGTNLAKEGKIHPALAVWAADIIMATAGVILFRRLLRN